MARSLTGTVTSNANHKTITVSVMRHVTHPVYKKRYLVTKKYSAHDEKSISQVNDLVEIIETRPISKTKTWKLSKVIKKAPQLHKEK